MRSKKILLTLGAFFTFSFAVNAIAASCTGISVKGCNNNPGNIPAGKSCSGYYIPPKTTFDGPIQTGTKPGMQCGGSTNACSNAGPTCS